MPPHPLRSSHRRSGAFKPPLGWYAQPPYIAERWLTPPYALGGNLALTANNATLCPIWIDRPVLLDRIGCRIGTGNGAPDHPNKVGIVSTIPGTLLPNERISALYNLTTGSTGNFETTIDEYIEKPGAYYILLRSVTGAPQQNIAAMAQGLSVVVPPDTLASALQGAMGYFKSVDGSDPLTDFSGYAPLIVTPKLATRIAQVFGPVQ